MRCLHRIITNKRKEIEKLKQIRPLHYLKTDKVDHSRDFVSSIRNPGLSIIAEIKKKSPSAGILRKTFNLRAIAESYEQNKADCLSVLTDAEFFGGSCEFIRQIKEFTKIPILRKDFIIDAYQIYESRAAGADAILLIVRLLKPERLREFLKLATQLDLACLVEIHSKEEIDIAVKSGAAILGINNRDLDTLDVDINLSLQLRPFVPEGTLVISESGINNDHHVRCMAKAGFDGILVGESLMRSVNPGRMVYDFKRESQNPN